jgi:cytochrome c-type biogenesis protein CcsB
VNLALASLSDNLVHAATGVMALAMLAHAGAWAFTRERRSAALAESRVAARAARSSAATVAAASGGAMPSTDARSTDVTVATLDRPGTDDASGADGVAGAGTQTSPGVGDGEETRAYRSDVLARIGVALTILATLLLGAGVLTRSLAAERVPWSNLYEFAISGAFVVAVGYLAVLRPLRLGFLGLPLTGFLLVVLGIAIAILYVPVSGLIPALQSYWLAIHVSAAVLATGVFTIAALTSLLQILKGRQERRGERAGERAAKAGGYLAQLPSAAALERIAYRLTAFAFPVWTFALIAGAIWAAAAWGRYWGWDPKETWMFITWVCYAAYLHARATAGWRDKVAWIGLVAYGALLFNLIGVNFLLPGLHSYTGM